MGVRAQPFPLQCEPAEGIPRRRCQGPHAITWEQAEEAYRGYAKFYGTGQSLERLAERRGFGEREYAGLLRLARDASLRPRDVFPL